jgi:hypothetical protein
MCFSTTGSLVIGTALAATGFICVKKAARTDKSFILFALIPLFFGVQQIIEGFVWIGLLHNLGWMTFIFAHAYVFFAFSFWPAYAPAAVYLVEKHENRITKRLLLLAMIFGVGAAITAFFLLMPGYLPLITKVVGHSISYDNSLPQILKEIFTLVYLLAVIPPFLVISDRRLKLFGCLLFVSAVTAQMIFSYAFVSVWCLFAGLLSLYIGYVVYRLNSGNGVRGAGSGI